MIFKSSYIKIGIWFKESAHFSLRVHFLSLWYKLLSINIRLIVFLVVPHYHIIAPRGVASLRLPLFTTFSRHFAWRSAATWKPPHHGWWRFMFLKKIDSTFLVSSKLIADIMFSIYGTPITLGLYTLMIYTGPLYIWIVITAISGLTGCYNHDAELISH